VNGVNANGVITGPLHFTQTLANGYVRTFYAGYVFDPFHQTQAQVIVDASGNAIEDLSDTYGLTTGISAGWHSPASEGADKANLIVGPTTYGWIGLTDTDGTGTPSVLSSERLNDYSQVAAVSDLGFAVLYPTSWDGSHGFRLWQHGFMPTELNPTIQAVAGVNNLGHVAGEQYAAMAGTRPVLARGQAVEGLDTLLPAVYSRQVKFDGYSPYQITNTDAILTAAQVWEGSEADAKWRHKWVLLETDTGKPPAARLSQLKIPSDVSIAHMNDSGWIVGLYDPSQTDSNGNTVHQYPNPIPVLLLPVGYKEVYPSSGFDGESEPNWLMVPENGSNDCKAITPASNDPTVWFQIGPPVSNVGVSPRSTHQANTQIAVNAEMRGDQSWVVPGGSDDWSSSNEGALGISVKKHQTKTVYIHKVTQHYGPTDYMPLQKGQGIPNVICVKPKPNATILDTSNHGGDDVEHPEDGTIDTGANGVCETTALSDHQQVQEIKVGWGIHKDISPQKIPPVANLKKYLNDVFGQQTNTFFEVVPGEDRVVNYDLDRSGILEVVNSSGGTGREENAIIVHRGEAFHIYYVQDYRVWDVLGDRSVSHDSIGGAKPADNQRLAFVRDECRDIFFVTAHEVGHLLKLEHTDAEKLKDGSNNLACIPNSDGKKRLMYFRELLSGNGTLLIKPEWDIINEDENP
jgi:hypothetical protein